MSRLCFCEDSVKQDLKTETPYDHAGAFLEKFLFSRGYTKDAEEV